MNIFVLDSDPKLNARYHADKHCVKMILEQTQLLTTVHHMSGTNSDLIPYRKTHHNHPCSKWSRKSLSNYLWLLNATKELCKEYRYRYNKHHKCEQILKWCENNLPNIPDIGLTPFAQAMPDEYKNIDVVKAYRTYYLKAKSHLFSWKKRETPHWVVREMINEKERWQEKWLKILERK